MPPFMATKLGIQFARFAAASGNATSASLRGAFNSATAGSSTTASSTSWAQGLSGSASSNGAGVGGAKFQAGRGAHSSFQQSGRAIVNANATSHDGGSTIGDDEDEFSSQQARIHRPGHLHRNGLLARRQRLHSRDVASLHVQKQRQITTTLPALQLILPRSPQLLITAGPGTHQQQARTVATTASSTAQAGDGDVFPTDQVRSEVTKGDRSASKSQPTRRTRPGRSQSLNEGVRRRRWLSPSEHIDLLAPLHRQSREIAIGDAMSEEVGEESLDEHAKDDVLNDPAILSMKVALDTGNKEEASMAVMRYRELDRSSQTLKGFNYALACFLWSNSSIQKMDDVYETYLQIVESGLTPDKETYSLMIRALCRKDHHEQDQHIRVRHHKGTHEGNEYAQAVSMYSIARATHGGKIQLSAHVALLESCAIRGDLKQASTVMAQMSEAKSPIPPTALVQVIECLGNGDQFFADESWDERHARILKSCREVLLESELRRANRHTSHISEAGLAGLNNAHRLVWNSMLKAAFRKQDTVQALELVELMINRQPLQDGCLPAPAPDAETSNNLVIGLASRGEFGAAFEWLERLMKLNSTDAKSEREESVMPMPTIKGGIIRLFNKIHTLADLTKLEADPSSSVAYLPRTLLAAPSLEKLISFYPSIDPEGHYDLANTVRRLLFGNLKVVQALDKVKDRDQDINAVLNISMQLIHRFVGMQPDQSLASTKSDQMTREAHEVLIPVNLTFIDTLINHKRYADAASLCSYAIELFRSSMDHSASGDKNAGRINLAQSLSGKLLRGTQVGIQASKIEEAQGFFCFVGFCLPALHNLAIAGLHMPSYFIAEAYVNARKFVKPAELGLSVESWNLLLTAFTSWESDSIEHVDDASFVLAEDIATLPAELQAQLTLEPYLSALKMRFSTTAVERLRQLGFQVADQIEDQTASSPSISASLGTDATSVSAQTSLTTESLLEEYSPVRGLRKDVSHLPPIQTIDEDHGIRCVAIAVGSRGKRERKPNPDQAFLEVMNAIQMGGQYPTVPALAELIVLSGRGRDLEKVHQLFLIGCQVLGALGGDVDWQMWSWQALENGMVCALAHAGEAKAASNHRHRLISAGCVPTADAYAALIAVVRDTTDDALIAEELYEESQRLGVTPTVYLYNTVISKMCRARKLDRAMQLYNEMLQRGMRPTSVTYGSMINGFTRTGDIANAEEMFAVMETSKGLLVKAPPFNTLIQYFTYTRQNREKALYYFNRLRELKVAPTVFTYKLLLDIYGNIEPVDLAGMESAFGELIADRTVHVESQHWAALINAHGNKRGDLEKAIAIFEAIPEHVATKRAQRSAKFADRSVRDAVTYEALLTVFHEHGRMDLMDGYLNRMKSDGVSTNAYIANVMIRGLANVRAAEQADGTLVAVDKENEAGLRQARALFEDMADPPMGVAAVGNHPPNHRHHANEVEYDGNPTPVASTSSFNGVLREPSTFETMIRVELAYGHTDKAKELVERMSARGYPPALITKASMLANGVVEAETGSDQQS